MGMLANYFSITEDDYRQLVTFDDPGDFDLDWLQDLEESIEEDYLVDVDKMWDAMHFVLTGRGLATAAHEDSWEEGGLIESLPSQLIFGHHLLWGDPHFGIVSPSQVKVLDEFFQGLDLERLEQSFSLTACGQADLYPSIWTDVEDEEMIREAIFLGLKQLRQLYHQAALAGRAIVASIS